MTARIRILVVDDHVMVRLGLRAFIETQPDFELVGEAGDGVEALELIEAHHPDIVLLDLVMPKMDGIEVCLKLKAYPDVRTLVLTSFAEDERVVAAIKAGAKGYLLKDSDANELKAAIRHVFHEKTVLSPGVTNAILRQFNHQNTERKIVDALTRREKEILVMLANGATNAEIAQISSTSIWTVRSHVSRILKKLGAKDRTQAALLAVQAGLVHLNGSEKID